jgi:hypothetical protein
MEGIISWTNTKSPVSEWDCDCEAITGDKSVNKVCEHIE